MTTPTFRAPTIELPQQFYLSPGRIMLSADEPVDLLVPDAEALLEVLLDICPDADDAVDNYLHRKGLIAIERQRP